MKKILILLTPFFAFAFALHGAISVSAASDYDDTIRVVDEFILQKNDYYGLTCSPLDLTLDYGNVIQNTMPESINPYGVPPFNQAGNPDQTKAENFKAAWLLALSTPGASWGITKTTVKQSSTQYQTTYQVYVNTDSQLQIGFEGTPDLPNAYVTNYNATAGISFYNGNYGGSQDCSTMLLYPETYDTPQTSHSIISIQPGPIAEAYSNPEIFYFTNANVTYPEDYEGQSIPDSPPNPGTQYDYVPNFQAVSGLDWKTDIRDTTFSTFDGILWTCSEDGNSIIDGDTGLAPVLYYQIWDDSTSTIVQDGFNNATAPILFQAEKLTQNKTYRIAGWYDCGGTVDFTDAANYEFTITANGLLGSQDLMQDCIIESFPFIDLAGCVSNLSIIVNALSFGIVNINNQWSSTETCHNLSVLGSWISRPGEQICPLFPSYVRTVVTPFVTFILGLITMRYLTGRMGDNY